MTILRMMKEYIIVDYFAENCTENFPNRSAVITLSFSHIPVSSKSKLPCFLMNIDPQCKILRCHDSGFKNFKSLEVSYFKR